MDYYSAIKYAREAKCSEGGTEIDSWGHSHIIELVVVIAIMLGTGGKWTP